MAVEDDMRETQYFLDTAAIRLALDRLMDEVEQSPREKDAPAHRYAMLRSQLVNLLNRWMFGAPRLLIDEMKEALRRDTLATIRYAEHLEHVSRIEWRD